MAFRLGDAKEALQGKIKPQEILIRWYLGIYALSLGGGFALYMLIATPLVISGEMEFAHGASNGIEIVFIYATLAIGKLLAIALSVCGFLVLVIHPPCIFIAMWRSADNFYEKSFAWLFCKAFIVPFSIIYPVFFKFIYTGAVASLWLAIGGENLENILRILNLPKGYFK